VRQILGHVEKRAATIASYRIAGGVGRTAITAGAMVTALPAGSGDKIVAFGNIGTVRLTRKV
jgi:hypothetical protein